MSRITLAPNASGSGTLTVAAPNTNTDRTLTLPDATGTVNISGLANEVPAGSAGSPSIYPTGDTNTGIFFPAADTIAFTEGGTERMRVDSSGNVGIGTSSPDGKIDIQMSSMDVVAGLGGNYPMWTYRNGSGSWFHAGKSPSADAFVITAGATPVTTEFMRIDSSGNVGINTSTPSKKLEVYAASASLQINSIVKNDTSAAGVAAIGFNVSSSASGEATSTKAGIGLQRNFAFGGGFLCFYNNNSGVAGDFTTADERMRIDGSGVVTIANLAGAGTRTVTATAAGVLAAASDSRLKQEVPTASIAGLAEIMQLRPVAYKWLDDIENRGDDAAVELGFFADEAKDIIPSAAPMGNDGYYGFYDRAVIAALTKAVQEQQQMIQALQADIAALKGV